MEVKIRIPAIYSAAWTLCVRRRGQGMAAYQLGSGHARGQIPYKVVL